MELKEAEAEARSLEDGWVIAEHPEVEGYIKVTMDSLVEVLSEQGWVGSQLINPDTGETFSEEARVALANAEAERLAAEQAAHPEGAQADGGTPADAEAAGGATVEVSGADEVVVDPEAQVKTRSTKEK